MRRLLATIALTAAAVVGPVSAQTSAPIKIGVLGDMSGPYADFGGKGSVLATQLAVEDFGGKLFGRQIEVVSADHQNKTDVALTIARRWYDNEGVDMITDLSGSALAVAVQGVAREKKKIDIVTSTATTELTNKACSPYGAHWTFDAYALANGAVRPIVKQGGKKWFFITADYTFGHNLEAIATKILKESGGQVVGHSLHPANSTDFSSHLIKAQASGADVVAFANAGTDTSNAVKQANEFGLTKKQTLAALLVYITDVHSMGLKNAQGLTFVEAFYWNRTPETRAWSERFLRRHGGMPTMLHAGTYSAVLHYLRAVKEANTRDADVVMKKMRETPVNDVVFKNGKIRPDGRMDHDMYLFKVKKPEEQKQPWDYYHLVETIPQGQAFMPMDQGDCPLVKGAANK